MHSTAFVGVAAHTGDTSTRTFAVLLPIVALSHARKRKQLIQTWGIGWGLSRLRHSFVKISEISQSSQKILSPDQRRR